MNSKKSKKNKAISTSKENKKKVSSKSSKPEGSSPKNDEPGTSSDSDWELVSSDSDDEYTEQDMDSYLRAFVRGVWIQGDDPGPTHPHRFYQYFCKKYFDETRKYLYENKKTASKSTKKTVKQGAAKGKKKKIGMKEEKVQAALLKLMPKLYKTQLKLMTRRILKAKPINHKLLRVLRDILKDKHLQHTVKGNPRYDKDLNPEELQIADLLSKCTKGYSSTHVAHDLENEYLKKLHYQKEKQKKLQRQAMAAEQAAAKGSRNKKKK